jgi:hypothetical protein
MKAWGIRCITTLLIGMWGSTGWPVGGTRAEAKVFKRTLSNKESLKKLARRFYGDDDYAVYIQAASDLAPFGDSSARTGTTVFIPTCWTYRIRPDDTWADLGRDYLGDAARGVVLARHNYKNPAKPPPSGHLITMPFQFDHTVKQRIAVRRLVKRILPRSASRTLRKKQAKLIIKYNELKKSILSRGQKITIPIFHVRVQKAMLPTEPPSPDPGARRRLQKTLSQLKALHAKGRYEKAATVASAAQHWAHLAPEHGARLYQALVVSYIALRHPVLALGAARKALALHAELALDPRATSPKVLAVFKKAGYGKTPRARSR